jgi:glycosyltransferase involved in cell wall biosynthesis
MKILAHCYGYPPVHNAGSENTVHAALRFLQGRGHEVAVIAAVRAEPKPFEGVPVLMELGRAATLERYQWADIVLTHLHVTPDAVYLAQQAERPLAHYIHNHNQVRHHQLTPATCDLMIFNTAWIQAREAWPGPSIVVNPPLLAERYRVTPGDAVTLINLDDNKGPRVVWELARRMPNVRFLGVRGSYGNQVMPPADLPNVEVLNNTSDIAAVYARTRVLLMPSGNESWGRTAMEAATSGIPTIASPTDGLRECLGDAGIYVDPADVDGWEAALRALLKPRAWKKASKAAAARAVAFQTESQAQLLALEAALQATIDRYAATTRELPPLVTFRCEQYPNLRVNAWGVQFTNGICRTRDPYAIEMLRRGCYKVVEVGDPVSGE